MCLFLNGHSHGNISSFFISDGISDIDSVHDENIVPDLNSAQESETSAVPTKAEEAKTGKLLYCI